LASSLFGKTRRSILALFYGHSDESFYVRQVLKIVNVGSGVVQREIEKLTASGILIRMEKGNQVHYTANKDCPIFEELKNLVMKTFGLVDVLKAALMPLAPKISVAFIYGSFAQGQQNASSDVDLMVVGEVSFSDVVGAVLPVQTKLRREVNPTVYSVKELRAKLSEKHHFLTSVLEREKIFLIGSERELGKLG
jgi:predicted nucleotidyltransferase